ncbi:aspartate carbamoyltransferase [Candidatus Kaiserbacteria bacterium RIFCSPLOWO2_02_FULL_51_13]|uniref:Aspartate carbamoyltransferase n=1 Tax=Candidatus Kaiserbacteria bacterium RIFCSPLOWO2_01_FULL_50_24 TaxID=1798507 RepID=A0A1F6EN11_9BACT|nr:MAG: aspartate carbamoyltransferase [Candidatus Kaiserbacteria bacterium RIFCSPLOWO2_01_FULL_50_24]OGG81667.1 MAG: aspartate carbamoyltransferase [Candidatus Kaiserbacteria bacterium RIFCSPLOWO2_02_FULL_51_13]
MTHLIETQQFDREALQRLFRLASIYEGKRDESLRGKILASLFYEPSTRTRLSFESAMLRLGGNVLSMENASESSSSTKGETIEDTIRIVDNYADSIVMRHPEAGAAARAAAVSEVPIINGGDGVGQHPTQAFLDLYTIEREIGRTDDFHIAFVGDLKYGRAARSLAYLLGKYDNVRMTFVSAPALKMKDDIKQHLAEHGVRIEEMEDLQGVMQEADVVYQTRVQKERFPSQKEHEQFKGAYVINLPMADSMKKGAILIHPLPRAGEIAPEVDDSPHAVYFKQAGYGVLVRMALLKTLLGEEKKTIRTYRRKK